ncbi:MAG: dTDP-4-dehydrorhamnose 3,5-epimerase [Alteromonadales bacterium]|nr:dTDP-4-dehydrorhamnose 3,5-epimerase [Alteromonadales bacterium]
MKGVELTPLKRISHPKGDILHALKSSENSFSSFGEAYFTSVVSGEIKGWKKHTRMCLNLIVPVGSVTFYIHNEEDNITETFLINSENYKRLTVQPGLWVAFKGSGCALNLILNVASIEHDANEAINKPLEYIDLVQQL